MLAPINAILDNFNRAGPALGANWAQAVSGYSMPTIDSSTRINWPQYPSCYWAAKSFAADQEVFVKKAVNDASGVHMFLRMNNPNSGLLTGYTVVGSSVQDNAVDCFRWDAGVATSIGWINWTITGGEVYLWATAVGNKISLYAGSDGVNYSLKHEWMDSTYSAGGYIGLYNPNNSTVSYLEDFGGGDIVVGPLFSRINDASDATVIRATAV